MGYADPGKIARTGGSLFSPSRVRISVSAVVLVRTRDSAKFTPTGVDGDIQGCMYVEVGEGGRRKRKTKWSQSVKRTRSDQSGREIIAPFRG